MGFGNARTLGTSHRSGAAILTGGHGRRGSMNTIYSNLSPKLRVQFIKNQAIFLYGPNGAPYMRGI